MVYIREAHAIDSRSPMGGGNAPLMEDPVSVLERMKAAETCMTKLALEPIPALIDDMEDSVNGNYGAWPDRLYLIGKDGRIAFRGGPGPFFFIPDELEKAIEKEIGGGGRVIEIF